MTKKVSMLMSAKIILYMSTFFPMTQERTYPLHDAVLNDEPHVIADLLDRVSVDERNENGKTALHLALDSQHYNCAGILIDAYASTRIKDPVTGFSPLHRVAMLPNASLLLRRFIDRGVDTNVQDDSQRTPLHVAAQSGNDEAIKTMLTIENEHKRAWIDAIDFQGNAPLHGACLYGQVKAVEILLQSGASYNIQNFSYQVPLHCVVQSDCDIDIQLILIQMLVEAGADINRVDNREKTAAWYAFKEKKWDVLAQLIRYGAYPPSLQAQNGEHLREFFQLCGVKEAADARQGEVVRLIVARSFLKNLLWSNQDINAARKTLYTLLLMIKRFERIHATHVKSFLFPQLVLSDKDLLQAIALITLDALNHGTWNTLGILLLPEIVQVILPHMKNYMKNIIVQLYTPLEKKKSIKERLEVSAGVDYLKLSLQNEREEKKMSSFSYTLAQLPSAFKLAVANWYRKDNEHLYSVDPNGRFHMASFDAAFWNMDPLERYSLVLKYIIETDVSSENFRRLLSSRAYIESLMDSYIDTLIRINSN